MRKQRPPLPSEPPPEVMAVAERRLREAGFSEATPRFALWIICHARVLWRHELGLDAQ